MTRIWIIYIQQNRLYLLSKTNPTAEHIEIYRKYKSTLTSIKRKAQRDFLSKELEDIHGKLYKCWKTL